MAPGLDIVQEWEDSGVPRTLEKHMGQLGPPLGPVEGAQALPGWTPSVLRGRGRCGWSVLCLMTRCPQPCAGVLEGFIAQGGGSLPQGARWETGSCSSLWHVAGSLPGTGCEVRECRGPETPGEGSRESEDRGCWSKAQWTEPAVAALGTGWGGEPRAVLRRGSWREVVTLALGHALVDPWLGQVWASDLGGSGGLFSQPLCSLASRARPLPAQRPNPGALSSWLPGLEWGPAALF